MNVPEGFARVGEGVLVRRGYEDAVAGWLERSSRDEGSSSGSGGRGRIRAERLGDDGRVYIRRYRRGGLLRGILRDVYWDRPPRPWRELVTTSAARERGVIAPEVLAAAALPVGRGACGLLYRGVLVTRAVEGRDSLASALQGAQTEEERLAWIDNAVRCIRNLHARGIHHPDLNVSNLLVGEDPSQPMAVIDFDRAVVSEGAVGALARRLARRRLSRSIGKLGLPGLTRAAAARALRGIVESERP